VNIVGPSDGGVSIDENAIRKLHLISFVRRCKVKSGVYTVGGVVLWSNIACFTQLADYKKF
jgi:hypothetical protein